MSDTSVMSIKDTSANPAPLGLIGFGMTTILLNIHNAGLYELNSMIMGMGMFVGGIAQIIAGILESKKNNTFGLTAFIAYGSFWLSLVAIWLLPRLGLGGADLTSTKFAMGFYLSIWGLFTFGMFIGTFRINKLLQVVFGSLTILFFLLAAGDFTGNEMITRIAGWEGIFCGFSAVYGSLAQVLNEVYGREILPIGAVKK